MTQIELFAGIGGFGLAGEAAGIETICQVEIDPYCQAVLKKNFPNAQQHSDIKTFDGTQWRGVDLISGGFPCQPYSEAGRRAGNDDDRALWPEMLRTIREVGPRWVVGENVAGLISMDGGRVFAGIIADLENIGYSVEAFVIPACAVGAPHRRDRVWIIAHARCGNERESGHTKEVDTEWHGAGARADSPFRSNCTASDLDGKREQQSKGLFKKSGGRPTDCLENSAFKNSGRQPRKWGRLRSEQEVPGGQANEFEHSDWRYPWTEHWLPVATRLCRVDDGLSAGVDRIGDLPTAATIPKKKKNSGKSHRLKALGNAIVPQIAYQIFQAIVQYEQSTNP